jgi:hypothetical protein
MDIDWYQVINCSIAQQSLTKYKKDKTSPQSKGNKLNSGEESQPVFPALDAY